MMHREGLTNEMAKDIFTIHTPMPEHEKEFETEFKEGYGLGFYLRESPYGLVFGHSGSNGDFEGLFEVYDDLKMGYVILTNSNTGDKLAFEMYKFLVEGYK